MNKMIFTMLILVPILRSQVAKYNQLISLINQKVIYIWFYTNYRF